MISQDQSNKLMLKFISKIIDQFVIKKPKKTTLELMMEMSDAVTAGIVDNFIGEPLEGIRA